MNDIPDDEYQQLKARLKVLESLAIDRKRIEDMLRNTLQESQQRQKEISALLKASSAILKYREFDDTAWAIFDS